MTARSCAPSLRAPFAPLLVVLALVLSSERASGQQQWPIATTEADRRAVVARLERYYADLSARHWEAFASHFWPGATLSTVWSPPGETANRLMTTTVPEFISQAPLGPDSKPIFEERMLQAAVTAHANLAHAWVRYEARFGEPGDVVEWRGIDAFTLLRHDGVWKIVAIGYTHEND